MVPTISLCSSLTRSRLSSSFFSSITLTHHRPSLRHNIKHHMCTTSTSHTTPKLSKKSRRETPENILRHNLNKCSKNNNVSEALRLYDSALSLSTPLSLHSYNVILYLCSHPLASPSHAARALDIFLHMSANAVAPNEATYTSLARLAVSRGDPDLAFRLIKTMSQSNIAPRLRSYGPALLGFCERGDVERAHEVERDMVEKGVGVEEVELAALFRLNSGLGRGDDVYRLLQRMRGELRVVSEMTAELIEGWFRTEKAKGVGVLEWDVGKVKEGVVKGGGGWHGEGWLGKGVWSVGRSVMDEDGVCGRCGDRMVCVDIDPLETEVFARSLAKLAGEKEVKADFAGFQVRVWCDFVRLLHSSWNCFRV